MSTADIVMWAVIAAHMIALVLLIWIDPKHVRENMK